MKIEKIEDIDTLFKQKIENISIDFHNTDWSNLEKQLDVKMPVTKTKSDFNTTVIKLVSFCLMGIAGLMFIYLINSRVTKTRSETISNQVIEAKDNLIQDNIFNTGINEITKKVEGEKVIMTKESNLINEKITGIDSSLYSIPIETKLDKEDTLIHFFW